MDSRGTEAQVEQVPHCTSQAMECVCSRSCSSTMRLATVIAWAQRTLDANKDLPTLVFTHDYLDGGTRTPYGEKLWQGLIKPNRQIIAVICGHMHTEFNQTSLNDAGLPVYELLADFQDRPMDNQGFLRLYHIQ